MGGKKEEMEPESYAVISLGGSRKGEQLHERKEKTDFS